MPNRYSWLIDMTQGHSKTAGIWFGMLRLAGLLAGTGIMLGLGAAVISAEPELVEEVVCWRGTIDVVARIDEDEIRETSDCEYEPVVWRGHAEVQLRERRETRTVWTQISADGRDFTKEIESTADLWYDWIEYSVKQNAYKRGCVNGHNWASEYDGYELAGRMEPGPGRPNLDLAGIIYYQVPEVPEGKYGPDYPRSGQYILNRLPNVCNDPAVKSLKFPRKRQFSGSPLKLINVDVHNYHCNFSADFYMGGRSIGIGFKGVGCKDKARFLNRKDNYHEKMEGNFVCDLSDNALISSGSITLTWSLKKAIVCEKASTLRQFR